MTRSIAVDASLSRNDLARPVVVDEHARSDLAGEPLTEVGRRQSEDVIEELARRAERELRLQPQQVAASAARSARPDRRTVPIMNIASSSDDHPLLAADEVVVDEDPGEASG